MPSSFASPGIRPPDPYLIYVYIYIVYTHIYIYIYIHTHSIYMCIYVCIYIYIILLCVFIVQQTYDVVSFGSSCLLCFTQFLFIVFALRDLRSHILQQQLIFRSSLSTMKETQTQRPSHLENSLAYVKHTVPCIRDKNLYTTNKCLQRLLKIMYTVF